MSQITLSFRESRTILRDPNNPGPSGRRPRLQHPVVHHVDLVGLAVGDVNEAEDIGSRNVAPSAAGPVARAPLRLRDWPALPCGSAR